MRIRALILTAVTAATAVVMGTPSTATHCMSPIIFMSYYSQPTAPIVSGPSASCHGGYITPGANTFEVILTRVKDPTTNSFICDPSLEAWIDFAGQRHDLYWTGCSGSSSGIGYHYFHPVSVEGPGWPANTIAGHDAVVTVCPTTIGCQSLTYKTVLP